MGVLCLAIELVTMVVSCSDGGRSLKGREDMSKKRKDEDFVGGGGDNQWWGCGCMALFLAILLLVTLLVGILFGSLFAGESPKVQQVDFWKSMAAYGLGSAVTLFFTWLLVRKKKGADNE
jgi:hypothetical protein